MEIKTFYNNPFQEACHILSCEGDAVIIDCGSYTDYEESRIEQYIKDKQLKPIAHLLTHGHLDHIFGAKWVFERYGLLPYIHPLDIEQYLGISTQAEMFSVPLSTDSLRRYNTLDHNFRIRLKDHTITFLHTPGHSEGSVCYLVTASETDTTLPLILFSGDTLFHQGFGRTDLPGGNAGLLYRSLETIMQLPPATIVYPGHGYPTTIEAERAFLRFV